MKFFYFLLISNVVCIAMHAQESSITTEISSDTIFMGNTGVIRYTAENLEVRFEGPEFSGLQVVSGPNVSTSMQFVNGKITSSLSYSYVFNSDQPGECYIGPAYFTAQDTVYETSPVTVLVIPNPGGIQQSKTSFKIIDKNISSHPVKTEPADPFYKKKKKKI